MGTDHTIIKHIMSVIQKVSNALGSRRMRIVCKAHMCLEKIAGATIVYRVLSWRQSEKQSSDFVKRRSSMIINFTLNILGKVLIDRAAAVTGWLTSPSPSFCVLSGIYLLIRHTRRNASMQGGRKGRDVDVVVVLGYTANYSPPEVCEGGQRPLAQTGFEPSDIADHISDILAVKRVNLEGSSFTCRTASEGTGSRGIRVYNSQSKPLAKSLQPFTLEDKHMVLSNIDVDELSSTLFRPCAYCAVH
ncbi:hypothetical protein BT69DRAFT_1325641 [Atractiella rhizophila]|nr:hypothetical protein BT69DRAFT_1325641 [Atractiella rhizophila]